MHAAPESGVDSANRHEWSDGRTRTRTGPQSTVSPPDAGSHCASAIPLAVDIAVEKEREPSDAYAECRAAEPLEGQLGVRHTGILVA